MIKTKNIFIAMLICVTATFSAHAADNGCDSDENDYINPTLALCSVHAYNVMSETNPSASERPIMNDVVALKATVMTQQMYAQYQYLESMVSRLKTQLKKAVLADQLQIAGASSNSNSSDGGSSTAGQLRGAQRCMYSASSADVFTCLRSNFNLLNSVSNYGKTVNSEIREQLKTDLETAKNYCDKTTFESVFEKGAENTDYKKCTAGKGVNGVNISELQKCLNNLNAVIMKCSEQIAKENRQSNNNSRN